MPPPVLPFELTPIPPPALPPAVPPPSPPWAVFAVSVLLSIVTRPWLKMAPPMPPPPPPAVASPPLAWPPRRITFRSVSFPGPGVT